MDKSQHDEAQRLGGQNLQQAWSGASPSVRAIDELPEKWKQFARPSLKAWQLVMASLGHPPFRNARERLTEADMSFARDMVNRLAYLTSFMTTDVRRHGLPLLAAHVNNREETRARERYIHTLVAAEILREQYRELPEEFEALVEKVRRGNTCRPAVSTSATEAQTTQLRTPSLDSACRALYALAKCHYDAEQISLRQVAKAMAKDIAPHLKKAGHGDGESGLLTSLTLGQKLDG